MATILIAGIPAMTKCTLPVARLLRARLKQRCILVEY